MQFALLGGPFNDAFKKIKSVGEHQLGQSINEILTQPKNGSLPIHKPRTEEIQMSSCRYLVASTTRICKHQSTNY